MADSKNPSLITLTTSLPLQKYSNTCGLEYSRPEDIIKAGIFTLNMLKLITTIYTLILLFIINSGVSV